MLLLLPHKGQSADKTQINTFYREQTCDIIRRDKWHLLSMRY